MITKLLASLGAARDTVITVVVVIYALSHFSSVLLDRKELPPNPPGHSDESRSIPATEKYVDQRIADLDAKSAIRHEAAMLTLREGMSNLAKNIEGLSSRVDTLARFTRHAAGIKAACPTESYAVYRGSPVQKVAYCP